MKNKPLRHDFSYLLETSSARKLATSSKFNHHNNNNTNSNNNNNNHNRDQP
jgi:hypothetical protein